MAAPHYSLALAGISEYLPDAHAERGAYFAVQEQLLRTDPISNPGAKYLHVAHLLQPEWQLRTYGSPMPKNAGRSRSQETLYNPKSLSDLLNYKS